MALEIIILAAGKGTRMHSDLPKVLHKIAGEEMILRVIKTAYRLSPQAIRVVVGHQAELVERCLEKLPTEIKRITCCIRQERQLGTGHAVYTAMPSVNPENTVLVLYGDTPLVPYELIASMLDFAKDAPLCVLSATAPNPYGYGRILRNNQGFLTKIVEEKDANEQQKLVHEVNTGIIVAPAQIFNQYLPKIKNDNSQGEYYLTDLAGLLAKEGKEVKVKESCSFEQLLGVNSKAQLALAERLFQSTQAQQLMDDGVTFADPKRFDLRGELKCGKDVFIDVNVVIEGSVSIGNRAVIGPGCVLKDCVIGDDCVLSPYTVIEGSELKQAVTIGPFARLRPGSTLEDQVHVGNFVEVKKSILGKGTKAGHLSYLGDTVTGRDVNIGAGTITCNYDGANKFKTIIGDDVFVGSDSQLVAPVEVKAGTTIAAGTTVTKHIKAEANALILTRAQACVIDNYQRPHKIKK